VLVPSRPFKPSVTFVAKARSLLSVANTRLEMPAGTNTNLFGPFES